MLVKYGARTEQIPPLRGVKGGVPEVFAVSYTPLAPLEGGVTSPDSKALGFGNSWDSP